MLKGHLRGTHRLCPPAETLARAQALMAAAGVTRVANVTGLDRVGVPVAAAYRPNARSLAVSQGKGLDLTAAKASALMEALEAYHAEHPRLALRLASRAEFPDAARVLDTERLPRLSVGTWDHHRRILWCEGQDLLSGGPVWVPYETVHTDFTLPLPAGSGCFFMSSNGLASGNHPLEAINHAICELIERDAVTLWALAGGTTRTAGRIDLDSIDDPPCREVLERMGASDLAVGVWDATSDLGVPTFACAIVDRAPNAIGQVHFSQGSGTHPARAVALLRALTEAAQTRLTLIAGTRDDAHRETFERARNPDLAALMRERIEGSGPRTLVPFDTVPTRDHDSFDADLDWMLERLAAVGVTQAAIVDLTRPDFGLPVVRAVVPGLESLHEAPGYRPGARARRLLQSLRS